MLQLSIKINYTFPILPPKLKSGNINLNENIGTLEQNHIRITLSDNYAPPSLSSAWIIEE